MAVNERGDHMKTIAVDIIVGSSHGVDVMGIIQRTMRNVQRIITHVLISLTALNN